LFSDTFGFIYNPIKTSINTLTALNTSLRKLLIIYESRGCQLIWPFPHPEERILFILSWNNNSEVY